MISRKGKAEMREDNSSDGFSSPLQKLYRFENSNGPTVGIERVQTVIIAYVAPLLSFAGFLIVLVYAEQAMTIYKYGIITGIVASIFLMLAPIFAAISGNIRLVGMSIIFTVWVSLSLLRF